MLRCVCLALLVAVFTSGPVASRAAAETFENHTLVIVHVNDLDRMGEADGRGGVARLARLIAETRAKPDRTVLATHGGDFLSPSLLSGFDRGAHMVRLMAAARIDLAVLGNHEFDFGTPTLLERVKEAKLGWLAANVRRKDGSLLPGVEARRIVSAGPFKVGVFGLTTPDTPTVSNPGPDLVFAPVLESARREAQALRAAGADLVIALAHVGVLDDLALARSGSGVDVVLSGHDHIELTYHDGRMAIVEAGEQANRPVVLEISLRRSTRGTERRFTWEPDFTVVDSATLTPDPAVARLVAEETGKLASLLDKPVGRSDTALDTRRAVVRGEEAAFGNLVADSLRAALGAEVALMNGGGIRGDRQYPAGHVFTGKDLATELPFGNKGTRVTLSGAELTAVLEQGLSAVDTRAGRFLQVSGLTLVYTPGKPAGSRLQSVTVGGKPLDPTRRYSVALPDFIANGGDGFAMLAPLTKEVDPLAGQLLLTHLQAFIAGKGRVAPKVEGRIVAK